METDLEGTQKNSLKRYLWMLFRVGLAGGIVWFLISRHLADFKLGLARFNYWWLIPAALAYYAHMLYCSVRWYRVAALINVKMSLAESFWVTMQSYFWTLVIPGGAIGGDVARLAIVSKRQPAGSKVEGVFTIIMDRIIGMVALFALTIVLVLLAWNQLINVSIEGVELSRGFKVLGIVGLLLMCLFGIAAMLALFCHRPLLRISLFARIFEWCNRRAHGTLDRLIAATDVYARNWKALIVLTFNSVFLVHLMTAVAMLFLICGLGVTPIDVLGVFTALTIGNIAGLIPFTVSGIGLRDITVLALLQATDMGGNLSVIPILYTGLVIVTHLSCSLFFVTDHRIICKKG